MRRIPPGCADKPQPPPDGRHLRLPAPPNHARSRAGVGSRPARSGPSHYKPDRAPLHRRYDEQRAARWPRASDADNTLSSGRSLSYVAVVALVIVAVAGIRVFALQSFFVPSASMEPTLCGGTDCAGGDDRILVNKLAYLLHGVHRGDVVVFGRPKALDGQAVEKNLVKRVVATDGDTVRWDRGTLWINNIEQHESYVRAACQATPSPLVGTLVVPDGDVFVMGDNRCNSEDSRLFGPISTGSIVGRAFVVYWPLGRLASL